MQDVCMYMEYYCMIHKMSYRSKDFRLMIDHGYSSICPLNILFFVYIHQSSQGIAFKSDVIRCIYKLCSASCDVYMSACMRVMKPQSIRKRDNCVVRTHTC